MTNAKPGDWAHDLAEQYAVVARNYESRPVDSRNELGAILNRAEEYKYRQIAYAMNRGH